MMHKNKKYHFNNQVYFLYWKIKRIIMDKIGKQILILSGQYTNRLHNSSEYYLYSNEFLYLCKLKTIRFYNHLTDRI